MRTIALILLVLLGSGVRAQEASRPLSPAEALTKVNQKVTVAMNVMSTGGKTARFLNSESDFRTEKNFAVFIPNVALALFKKAGIEDPAEFYKDKSILATGNVEMGQSRPQLRVENPNQIKIVTPGGKSDSVKRSTTAK